MAGTKGRKLLRRLTSLVVLKCDGCDAQVVLILVIGVLF